MDARRSPPLLRTRSFERWPDVIWQFWLGRFLQSAAAIGALLTLVEWVRRGGAGVRVGYIVLWSAVAGAVAATMALRRLRRSGCPR